MQAESANCMVKIWHMPYRTLICTQLPILAERIRRVENLRRTIEKQWQANCGFSREMSKALVNRIVVDADESKTCITLDVFLTAGRESCTDSVLPAAQSSDAPLKLTFPRPRSDHQGGYEVTYLVRWHLD